MMVSGNSSVAPCVGGKSEGVEGSNSGGVGVGREGVWGRAGDEGVGCLKSCGGGVGTTGAVGALELGT